MSRYESRDGGGGGGGYRGGDREREGKVYVGDLPRDASEDELDKAFGYYGPIRNIWISRDPHGYAFVEFEEGRDAEDAIKELNGSKICGVRARVEMSHGRRRGGGGRGGGGGRFGGGDRGGGRGGRIFNPDDRCYNCGGRGHYAYDCNRSGSGGGGGGGGGGGRRYSGGDRRSRSRERSRRSYSRSPSRGRRSYSRSRSK